MKTGINEYHSLWLSYLHPHALRLGLLSALLLGGIGLQLANPQVMRYFIDAAQANGSMRLLLLAALAFIVLSLVQGGLSLWAGYSAESLGWSVTNTLRRDLMLHGLRLDMDFHKKMTPGELIERIDGDVTGLANFFSQFILRLVGNILLVLGILALLFRENLVLGLGISLYAVFILAALAKIQKSTTPIWAAARQAQAEQFGFLEERIGGIEDIRSAGAEEYTLHRLQLLMREVMVKSRLGFLSGSLMKNTANLFTAGGYIFGLVMGVLLYTQGNTSLGSAFLIVYYIDMLTAPLQAIREQVQDFQTSSAILDRVLTIFKQRSVVIEPANPCHLPVGALSAAFDHVSFHYESDPDVLRDVSFKVEAGRLLGVLGRTGSGKSTLARLIYHLYDPNQGDVYLGGLNLHQVSLDELRCRVGLVTQEVQLFQASLRDNLTFFSQRQADSEILELLKDLQLWDWYTSLPGGLEASLVSGSQGLSAGQAQLLALLRVFLKDPGLVILDEASSRLDPATETLIERTFDRLFTRRTGILIAHRLRSLERADDLLILENGQVVEYGPRQKLRSDANSHYSRLLQTGLDVVTI